MNNTFKIGDKVVCVNNNLTNYLILYKIYCVIHVEFNSVRLEGLENHNFFANRFILLSENRKQKIKSLL
jgi:hypothetical protein